MGQFSVKIYGPPGSILGATQHLPIDTINQHHSKHAAKGLPFKRRHMIKTVAFPANFAALIDLKIAVGVNVIKRDGHIIRVYSMATKRFLAIIFDPHFRRVGLADVSEGMSC